MKNLLLSICFMLLTGAICSAQQVSISGAFDARKEVIKLSWNMVNSSSKSAYVLLRSGDGKVWTEAAKDRILRDYSSQDVYSFDDKFYTLGKNFYRLKITDAANNPLALSSIITVNANPLLVKPQSTGWMIYPNPAGDVLTLAYKGNGNIEGVVNVQIQDVTGKIVIKFRSASIYKTIQIPVSKLKRGMYVVQVSVVSESVLNQQFFKN